MCFAASRKRAAKRAPETAWESLTSFFGKSTYTVVIVRNIKTNGIMNPMKNPVILLILRPGNILLASSSIDTEDVAAKETKIKPMINVIMTRERASDTRNDRLTFALNIMFKADWSDEKSSKDRRPYSTRLSLPSPL